VDSVPSEVSARRPGRLISVVAVAVALVAQIALYAVLLPFAVPVGLAVVNTFPSSGGPPVPVDTADISDAGALPFHLR